MMNPTVAQYVVQRLASLGIEHVFGVPGDYSFPIDNALEACKSIQWIACANELNAGYAADDYARARGAALLCTTYGVGELSALNAMMGSKAERLPVFHLVGIPSQRVQRSHKLVHHSMGNGAFDQFFSLLATAACVSTLLTPENVVAEMERVIHEAFLQRRPAYIAIAADYAVMEIIGEPIIALTKTTTTCSEPRELAAALEAILKRLAQAKSPVILPAFTIARYGLQQELEKLLTLSGIPYATTIMDKAVISESHPSYLGMYTGSSSHAAVREVVESADLIINFGGVLFTDLSTMFFSHQLHHAHMITIWPDYVEIGENLSMMTSQSKTYGPVAMHDVLAGLINALEAGSLFITKQTAEPVMSAPAALIGKAEEQVTTDSFYSRIEHFLKPEDHIVVETGFCMLPMASMHLPKKARYYNQTLWSSIGWATPAALGIALAHPQHRTLLVTGDGAHQCTANEIGTMGRYGIKPIIFLINDGTYAIEEFLDQNKGHTYNSLAPWSYSQLPEIMGCHDWFKLQIQTNAELEAALEKAQQQESACYFEILLGSKLRPPASEAMTEALNQKFPPTN